MIEFAVRAKTFETYEKFAKTIQRQGWNYKDDFIKFYPSSILFNNCIYLSTQFDGVAETRSGKYRFSNCGENEGVIFNLDTDNGFIAAVMFAKTQMDKISGIEIG